MRERERRREARKRRESGKTREREGESSTPNPQALRHPKQSFASQMATNMSGQNVRESSHCGSRLVHASIVGTQDFRKKVQMNVEGLYRV